MCTSMHEYVSKSLYEVYRYKGSVYSNTTETYTLRTNVLVVKVSLFQALVQKTILQ